MVRAVGRGVGEKSWLRVGVKRGRDRVGGDIGVVWHCGYGVAVGENHAVEGCVEARLRTAAALG
jgi:hypothetical protein